MQKTKKPKVRKGNGLNDKLMSKDLLTGKKKDTSRTPKKKERGKAGPPFDVPGTLI